ncbi:MAG TPA: nucleotide exchange factor GrpE, partial [Leptospiraceae bacterium]|nr:nucleotide exchange factor GrpE [Leptospiraceae bacterium]
MENEVMEETQNEETLEGVDVAAGSPDQKEQPASESGSVNLELEKAKAEAMDMRDSWNRERAEFQNYKKRMIHEMGRARSQAVKSFVSGLLPVIDNLNQVLLAKSEDPAVKNFVIGVEMIRSEFLKVLNKENIQSFRPLDQAFDPMRMEAVALDESESVDSPKVVEVYED